MKVKRETLTGTEKAITFDTKCGKWLVKNFSTADMYVSFTSGAETNSCIKVPKNCGQIIVDNEFNGGHIGDFRHDTIYVTGTGEVEVQQLCWN